MLAWIDEILKPYIANTSLGIVPILFLDDFSIHKMGEVIQAIQALGMEVELIPPGCTGMVQPVDMGYNKLFKAKVRSLFHEWLFEQDPDKPAPCPPRHLVAAWIIGAEHVIEDTMVHKAWKKMGFSSSSMLRGGSCSLFIINHCHI